MPLQERELCASARMLPAHYMAVKAAMLREAARRGVLPRSEARTMFRLDHSRALKVCLIHSLSSVAVALLRPIMFLSCPENNAGPGQIEYLEWRLQPGSIGEMVLVRPLS